MQQFRYTQYCTGIPSLGFCKRNQKTAGFVSYQGKVLGSVKNLTVIWAEFNHLQVIPGPLELIHLHEEGAGCSQETTGGFDELILSPDC